MHRCHRGDPSRPACWNQHRQHRHADPDDRRDDDRPECEHGTRRREAATDRVEQSDDQTSDADAAEDPDRRADDADPERLGRDQPLDLPGVGTDRAEQGEFTKTLADRDLEDVVDDERGDERRDEGEHEQPGLEDVDELPDGVLCLGDQLVAVDHLDALRNGVLHCGLDVGESGVVDDAEVDRVDATVRSVVVQSGREVEGDDRRAEQAVGVGGADRSDEGGLVGTGVGDVADGVAEREALAVCGRLVEHEFVGTVRLASLLESDAGKALAVPHHAELRTGGGDHVAVRIEDRGASLNVGLDNVDAVDAAHIVGDLDRDRFTSRISLEVVLLEGPFRANHEIGVLHEFGDESVDRALQAVGKDERAGDERDAGHHGDDDRHRAADTRTDAAPRDERG